LAQSTHILILTWWRQKLTPAIPLE
jgi:hypothetical protein